MMTLMIAAVAAVAQPSAQGTSNAAPGAYAQHEHSQHAKPKAMDCCDGCCKDMAKKHQGQGRQ